MISKINKKVKDKNHKSNFSKNFKVCLLYTSDAADD